MIKAEIPELDSFETIDLVLRADPAPAEATVDIVQAWDGEIVLSVRVEK